MLDIGTRFLYDKHMDKISITQLMDVTGMSYPTALAFANEHGSQENGGQRARWMIPINSVRAYVVDKEKEVSQMRQTLDMYASTPKR